MSTFITEFVLLSDLFFYVIYHTFYLHIQLHLYISYATKECKTKTCESLKGLFIFNILSSCLQAMQIQNKLHEQLNRLLLSVHSS